MCKGPLVVYSEDSGIVRAMRNIPGVEMANVSSLNLLKLAPGGHLGRFVIWTQGAFKKLNEIYGTLKSGALLKKGYHLPRAQMENADLDRIINSTEVQSVLRPKLEAPKRHEPKKNALKHKELMEKLNPAHAARSSHNSSAEEKAKRVKASKEHNKKFKKGDNSFYKKLMKAFEPKVQNDGEAEAEE